MLQQWNLTLNVPNEVQQTLKQTKLDFLDSALFKWFSTKHMKGMPAAHLMIVNKASV